MQAEMLHTMPAEYRRDNWTQVIFEACQGALEGRALDQAAALGGELLLSRMSETQLAIEERLCAIIPKEGQSIADRRSAVAARWRSGGPVTIGMLQGIADSWQRGEVQVSYTGGALTFTFVNQFGVPDDLESLQKAIDAVRPAHIPTAYIIRYRTWKEIRPYTWAQLAAHTWGDVKEGSL